MAKRYSERPRGALKGVPPIWKAIDVATRHCDVVIHHGHEMTENYAKHNEKIRTDPDYARKVYTKYIVNLATWYQAMEDLNLSRKLAEIMASVKKRAREIAPRVEDEVYEVLERTIPGYKRPEKKLRPEIKVEILAR